MVGKTTSLQRKIKSYLRSHGITQKELAMGIGLSPSSLSALLSGKTSMSVDRLIEICEFIGVVPGEVIDEYVEDLYRVSRTPGTQSQEKGV